MLDTLRQLLEQSPLLALFAAIGIGYALGRISVFGCSLEVGAVLFAGLALGAIAPRAAPPPLVGSIGLVMFLYGIGIQYGRQFFTGLAGPGLTWNLIAALAVVSSLVTTLLLARAAHLPPAVAMGLFAGALTSTPTLQAAIDATGSGAPAIGYSAAYPIGVVGPILCLYAASRLFARRLAAQPAPLESLEITLDEETQPMSVADVIAGLQGTGVTIVAVRQLGTNRLPDPGITLKAGDGLMFYGSPAGLDGALEQFGRAARGRLSRDRRALDIQRFFVSRAAAVGVPIARLQFPAGVAASVVSVRRGDSNLLATPDLVLEYGDRVAVVAPPAALGELRRHFGDSIKSTTEFSYISVGVGMSLGVLLGLVRVPIPGLGPLSLGVAGGPLLAALILGRLGRTGFLSWHMPLPANLTLRTFGLTIFLAAVGLGSGAPFVAALSTTGLTLVAIGAAVTTAGMVVALALGQYVGRLATDDLLGVASGVAGNPAVLVSANRLVPSDRIDAAYATVFPSTTILKIVCAQVAIALSR